MKLYIRAARTPKKIDILVLQGNYGYGWDDLSSYEATSEGRRQAKIDEDAYIQNEHIPTRIITRSIDNPSYDPKQDSLYRNLIKRWSGIKNIIGDDNHLIPSRSYLIESDVFDEIGGVDTVLHNPKILNDYSYAVDFLKDKDLGWVEYLDDVREAIRSKFEIISENGTFGEVPVAIMFDSITKYSRKPAIYITVYDV